jgi:hypothetical protein
MKPDIDLGGPIPILIGRDGFVTYCLLCERVVNPPDPYARLMRSCVTGALFDRFKHLKEFHP